MPPDGCKCNYIIITLNVHPPRKKLADRNKPIIIKNLRPALLPFSSFSPISLLTQPRIVPPRGESSRTRDSHHLARVYSYTPLVLRSVSCGIILLMFLTLPNTEEVWD